MGALGGSELIPNNIIEEGVCEKLADLCAIQRLPTSVPSDDRQRHPASRQEGHLRRLASQIGPCSLARGYLVRILTCAVDDPGVFDLIKADLGIVAHGLRRCQQQQHHFVT